MDRFWQKVNRAGADECWLWTACTVDGYGQFSLDGKRHYAHRFAYELLVGPIPEALQLDHLCRNRACVNPGHLEPVTGRENVLRGETLAARNAAKTQCPRGHAYDRENTTVDSRGERSCRSCRREQCRRYQAARKAVLA